VEPIPETREALRRLADLDDSDLGRDLDEAASALVGLVPDLVGFSISIVQAGITFTYRAPAGAVRDLGAVRDTDSGASEEALPRGWSAGRDRADLLDEGRWRDSARERETFGVASSLSLPILDGTSVVGGVDLYAHHPHTFEGRHEELARLFGAWAPGAVINADLSFSSRLEAAQAVERLEEMSVVDVAVGMVVAEHGLAPQEARARLAQAADRAGVSLAQIARHVVDGKLEG
jgi:GAF domain-containing protein